MDYQELHRLLFDAEISSMKHSKCNNATSSSKIICVQTDHFGESRRNWSTFLPMGFEHVERHTVLQMHCQMCNSRTAFMKGILEYTPNPLITAYIYTNLRELDFIIGIRSLNTKSRQCHCFPDIFVNLMDFTELKYFTLQCALNVLKEVLNTGKSKSSRPQNHFLSL